MLTANDIKMGWEQYWRVHATAQKEALQSCTVPLVEHLQAIVDKYSTDKKPSS